MSFRSQGDQREHSDMADTYLSFTRINLNYALIVFLKFLILKNKQKENQHKEIKAVLLFVQISISKLCKLLISQKKNNTLNKSYLNQRHYNGYLRLNKRKVFIPIQLVNKHQSRNIEQTTSIHNTEKEQEDMEKCFTMTV